MVVLTCTVVVLTCTVFVLTCTVVVLTCTVFNLYCVCFNLYCVCFNLFCNVYCSPNIVLVIKSRIMRWAGHVVCMGERRGAYRILVGEIERKRPLERPRHRWEGNI